MPNANKVANRLINEKSPYLLQHAHNPVDWYPWGLEAFSRAVGEDKPIFLSIGYSTCHWCHVMERESFEDEEVAQILNENYISIKVDRELRPDIDSIYMRVCQAMTGSGGWPMSIFMTPEQKPFFAGTYFPKNTDGQFPGFIELCTHIADMWKTDKNRLINSTKQIEVFLKQETEGSPEEPDQKVVEEAYNELKTNYDPTFGGFSYAPKFPTPHYLFFLLRYYKLTSDRYALDMVEHTLKSMYKGGIFDHIGYGFSRYSTDNRWLVPHFEKMLYDNALLAMAYTECFAVSKNQLYADIAEKIFTYVLRDITSPDGAFYSAEDADSEGVEGKFYVWSYKELFRLLNKNRLNILCNNYAVTPEGNFEGANILNLIQTDLDIINNSVKKKELEEIRSSLLDERLKRVRPFRDTKILISWNGMMIAALAIGGRVLLRSDYIMAAKKAVHFIFNTMTSKQGQLLSGYKDGKNSSVGYLDDYAYLIWGLIELYRSTFEPVHLKKALELNRILTEHFWDNNSGGFFFYGKDHEELLIRPKEHYDGATPSGNSISAMNLLYLYDYTGEIQYKEQSEKLLKAFGTDINSQPTAHIHFLTAFMTNSVSKRQVIFTGKDKSELQKIRQKLDRNFLPFTTCLVFDGNNVAAEIIPSLKDYKLDDRVTAYVCENFTCQQPTQDIDAVLSGLH